MENEAKCLEFINPPEWYSNSSGEKNLITASSSRIYYLNEAEKWATEQLEREQKRLGYSSFQITKKDVKVVRVLEEDFEHENGEKKHRVRKKESLYFIVFLQAECN